MLRLGQPVFSVLPRQGRLMQLTEGGEANVAVSLANYGEDVEFVTRLPQNDLAMPA